MSAALDVPAGGASVLPLEAEFEHAVLVLSGSAVVDGAPLAPGALLYLGTGRRELGVSAETPARLMLLGGAPFEERVVMWWNFVARSHDEILDARAAWLAGERLGTVAGAGDPLPAPPLPPGRLTPGGAARGQ